MKITDVCPKCKRVFEYPVEDVPMVGTLTPTAFINGHPESMCPLCYAEAVRRIHGIEWEPQGEMAQEVFEMAKKMFPNWR